MSARKKILCCACGAAKAEYACSACAKTFYCSKKCQRRDWCAHRQKCRALLYINVDVVGEEKISKGDDVDGRHPNVLVSESAAGASSKSGDPEYYNPLEEDLDIAKYTKDRYMILHTGSGQGRVLPPDPRREPRVLDPHPFDIIPQKRPRRSRTQEEKVVPPVPVLGPVPVLAGQIISPLQSVEITEPGFGEWETFEIERGMVPPPTAMEERPPTPAISPTAAKILPPAVVSPPAATEERPPTPAAPPAVISPPIVPVATRPRITFAIKPKALRPSTFGGDPFGALTEQSICC